MSDPETEQQAPTEEQIIAGMGEDGSAPIEEAPVSTETEEPEGEGEPEPIVPPEVDEPPEFWSAEKKAIWAQIPPEFRSHIRDHVVEVSKGTARKLEEAAAERKRAEEASRAAIENQDQLANWWKQTGPQIARLIQGKWAGVDWNKLSAENPGEWARLRQEYENDQHAFREANERHQAEIRKQEQRQQAAHQDERRAEHAKLASDLPKEFGTAEAATKTYATLSQYLKDNGIADDRIGGVYEANIVKIVNKAYLYDQLQAKAKGVTDPKQAAAPATTTPKRVTPGAGRPANQGSDRERQALERLRNGESTEEVMRWAFR